MRRMGQKTAEAIVSRLSNQDSTLGQDASPEPPSPVVDSQRVALGPQKRPEIEDRARRYPLSGKGPGGGVVDRQTAPKGAGFQGNPGFSGTCQIEGIKTPMWEPPS